MIDAIATINGLKISKPAVLFEYMIFVYRQNTLKDYIFSQRQNLRFRQIFKQLEFRSR